jgi:cytochrome b561
MTVRNSELRYGSVAMGLHWLIAGFVIVNLGLGLYMADLPKTDPYRFMLFQTHKSIGLTVLVLSLLRLGWRLVNPVPPLPRGMGTLMRFAARGTHILLYILIVAIPLAGWALVSSSPLGLPTPYFGLFPWPNIPFLADLPRAAKMQNLGLFAEAHVLLAWSAIVLIVLHVAGALYHQVLRRDDVMKRMLPGTSVSDPA